MERLDLNYYYRQEAEQFTFYRLPKALITDSRFKEVSNNAKLLYGLMLDRMSLSARSGWFDEENRVYIKYAVKTIMEDLNCSKPTAVGLIKELQNIGLIDIVQQSGLANIIYVKNFVSGESSEEINDRSKNLTGKKSKPVKTQGESKSLTGKEVEPVKNIDQSENITGQNALQVNEDDQSDYLTGGGKDFERPVVKKVNPINTNINNTELNENNHINLSADYEIDSMDQINRDAEAYMDIIRENIDYDIMMSDKRWEDREMYDELYQIICDVVCVPKKVVRIGGENYPYNLVKSKFLKLTSSHLQYVIGCMKNNTTKVGNIRAYLITALYNAPNTMSHYYSPEVNHDLYGVV